MKTLILLIFFPLMVMGQIQIGEDIDGEEAGDEFGTSVSISSNGNIIAVGAIFNGGNGVNSGHVRVYENIDNNWVQLGEDIDGESSGDWSGNSVGLSSNGFTVAIGSPFDSTNGSNSGSVRVFELIDGNWMQIGSTIYGQSSPKHFGSELSISDDGNVLAISGTSNTGYVRVYEKVNNDWNQIGEELIGINTSDNFGSSIDLSSDGHILAIGADGDNDEVGYVKVFTLIGESWIQVNEDIIGESQGDNFGRSVDLASNGSILGIGVPGGNNFMGKVEILEFQDDNWTQLGMDISVSESDFFGADITLSSDGTVVSIGSPFENGSGPSSGIIRTYKFIDNNWIDLELPINGESSGDSAGFYLDMSDDGSTLLIGSRNNFGNGVLSGHARVFNLDGSLSTQKSTLTNFSLYPNPTKNQFNIQLADGETLEKVTIYNNLGQLITTTLQTNVDTSALSSGVYFVSVKTTTGKGLQKLIIE